MAQRRGTSWQVEFGNGLTDEVKSEPFYGVREDAIAWAESQCSGSWYVVSIRPKRGGKRANAGTSVRVVGGAKVTKRVSPELANKLDDIQFLLARLKDWEARSEDASPTSPRWEQCRRLLAEINELWQEES